MRTTDYERFHAPPRWLFLKVTTSQGTVGREERVVEGRAQTVARAVEELFDSYLLGDYPNWHNPFGRHEDGGVAEW